VKREKGKGRREKVREKGEVRNGLTVERFNGGEIKYQNEKCKKSFLQKQERELRSG
jgi:hypothetical protein